MKNSILRFVGVVSFGLVVGAVNGFSETSWVPGPLALRSIASEAPASKAVTAQVYEMGSDHKKVLFTMKRTDVTEAGKTTIIETFYDPQGQEALKASTMLENGRFVSYALDQEQTHEKAKIDVSGGKVRFEFTESSGKVKKDDENWDDRFILPAMMGRLVKNRWQDLLDGKDVEMRFGVPERLETVGFKLHKDGEGHVGGQDAVIIKMKPTSFVIAAIVKPLYFYFDKTGEKLLEFRGRTLPKIRDGDKWKDLDAESVYSY